MWVASIVQFEWGSPGSPTPSCILYISSGPPCLALTRSSLVPPSNCYENAANFIKKKKPSVVPNHP